jgi:DNA-binding response OmpR family regulator
MKPAHDELPALLVVDDELAFLALYAIHLGPLYRLLLCRSGSEALDAIEREHQAGRAVAGGFFHLYLADGMNRGEAIRRARALEPGLLCTVVGGRDEDEQDYFARPLTAREMLHRAKNAMTAWRARV